MKTHFNNKASHCLFIGDNNLDEVIAEDERELLSINGSFDAIADRMEQLTNIAKRTRRFPYDVDDKVSILSYVVTRGIQECPFSDDCRINGYISWSEDALIKSKKTGNQLVINSGTAHLARQHHLLEKDNKYGISAKEFYEFYM